MGGSDAPRRDFGDKKPVWKLVNGRPKMVLIKPGLTDGSSTQMLEGELEPGDQLVTEIIGAPTGPARKLGAF
jgi:HlyD family secretion protein